MNREELAALLVANGWQITIDYDGREASCSLLKLPHPVSAMEETIAIGIDADPDAAICKAIEQAMADQKIEADPNQNELFEASA